MSNPHPKPRGRPKGSKCPRKPASKVQGNYTAETMVRAHQIYWESDFQATSPDIAKQLAREGYEPVPAPDVIARWRRVGQWKDRPVRTPLIPKMGEELRQAVQVNIPDDLNRIERASMELSDVSMHLAAHIRREIPKIDLRTPADLEIATRSISELVKATFAIGKGLQDLRLLRVSSNFADRQEIIPPDRKPDAEADDRGEQARVLSNFG